MGVADGYHNEPANTADRFVRIKDEVYFMTNDVGYMDKGGVFHYRGRSDSQVKVRGQKVSLAEVECTLSNITSIKEAAVVALSSGQTGEVRLYAFVTPSILVSLKVATAVRPCSKPAASHGFGVFGHVLCAC